LERPRDLVAAQLDARKRVVVAHAADPEPKPAQHALGAFDHPQLLVGDLAEVWDPRGEARGRGLVPRWQPGAARQLADLSLRQIRGVERAADAELARRLAARTVVAAIIGVAAVADHLDCALARERRPARIELVLAVIAAVCVIR